VNQYDIKLQSLETNKAIVKKWARNAKTHISRILIPIQHSSVFTEYEQLYDTHQHIEAWNPPPPPTLQFMPNPKQAWKEDIPKTIMNNKKTSVKRKTYTSTTDQDMDNNTTTTVNTTASYTQDTISELQNHSQQQQAIINNLLEQKQ
jgi:hypothetical protein